MILPRPQEARPIEAIVEDVWPNAKMNRRVLAGVVSQVRDYWNGKQTKAFQVEVDLEGFSPFYRRVWRATMRIPAGEVRTYKEIATAVGSPKACRAVGGAMAANPMPLIVPCHRVVATSGVGGFSAPGGINLKETLLQFEKEAK